LDLVASVGREHVDDAVDRLGRVVGVQGGDHQVPGLRDGQGGGDALEVAHLADEHDVRVLAEHRLQRRVKRLGIGSHLPLAHRSGFIFVQIFDRILDGDDVAGRLRLSTSIIDAIDVDLPEPVGPVTRIRPLGLRKMPASAGGRPNSSGRRDVHGDAAQRKRAVAALVEGVGSDSGLAPPRKREVHLFSQVQPVSVLVEDLGAGDRPRSPPPMSGVRILQRYGAGRRRG
jgi:hypothetical protein